MNVFCRFKRNLKKHFRGFNQGYINPLDERKPVLKNRAERRAEQNKRK
jgi:hypothetical protein